MDENNEVSDHIKKVVVIGPESTGKSTLSAALATYYNTAWVPEYARHYIERLDRPYEKSDLSKIAEGQLQWEDEKVKEANKLLICDTDLIVIKIWSEHKYGDCASQILEQIKSRPYDLYLLTDVDLPWQEDPQRENPHLRDYFMDIFEQEIEATGVPFVKISGDHYQRMKKAVEAVDGMFR
ncbi:MAG: ATP-binding protein [Fulvivirga sp.]